MVNLKNAVKGISRTLYVIVTALCAALGNTATYMTAILGVFIAPEWFYENALSQPWFFPSMSIVFLIICAGIMSPLIKQLLYAFAANASMYGSDTSAEGLNNITADKHVDWPKIIGEAFGGIGAVIIVGALLINIAFPMYHESQNQKSIEKRLLHVEKIIEIQQDVISELQKN
jgi:hypothetical protein